VSTPDGARSMHVLAPGDVVWSWNVERQVLVARRVTSMVLRNA